MICESELLAAVQQATDWLCKNARWGRARAAAACGWAAVQLAQRDADVTPQLIVSTAKYDERELCGGPLPRDPGHRKAKIKVLSLNKALQVVCDDPDPLAALEILDDLRHGGEL